MDTVTIEVGGEKLVLNPIASKFELVEIGGYLKSLAGVAESYEATKKSIEQGASDGGPMAKVEAFSALAALEEAYWPRVDSALKKVVEFVRKRLVKGEITKLHIDDAVKLVTEYLQTAAPKEAEAKNS